MTHKERTLKFLRPEAETVFPIEEYRQRLNRARSAMEIAGIDMLYLTSPEAVCYLSGYRAEWYQAQGPKAWLPVTGIAVHVNACDHIHFEVQNEQVLAGFTTVSGDLRIFGGDAQPSEDVIGFIVSNLDDEGWLKGTVGLEMHSYRPNRAVSERLQAGFEGKGAAVVDGSDIVNGVRKIKSPAELAVIRTAARIGDIGMQTAIETIRPGVTELDVWGEMVRAMARAGGEPSSITMPVSSGAKSACMHALASRRKIMPGDVVNVDICGVYHRYHSNIARTMCVGEPHPEVARYLDAVTGVKAMLENVIRPGLPVRAGPASCAAGPPSNDRGLLQGNGHLAGPVLGRRLRSGSLLSSGLGGPSLTRGSGTSIPIRETRCSSPAWHRTTKPTSISPTMPGCRCSST